jgi:hypothetical protein
VKDGDLGGVYLALKTIAKKYQTYHLQVIRQRLPASKDEIHSFANCSHTFPGHSLEDHSGDLAVFQPLFVGAATNIDLDDFQQQPEVNLIIKPPDFINIEEQLPIS